MDVPKPKRGEIAVYVAVIHDPDVTVEGWVDTIMRAGSAPYLPWLIKAARERFKGEDANLWKIEEAGTFAEERFGACMTLLENALQMFDQKGLNA